VRPEKVRFVIPEMRLPPKSLQVENLDETCSQERIDNHIDRVAYRYANPVRPEKTPIGMDVK
jgi:hypothetical protein